MRIHSHLSTIVHLQDLDAICASHCLTLFVIVCAFLAIRLLHQISSIDRLNLRSGLTSVLEVRLKGILKSLINLLFGSLAPRLTVLDLITAAGATPLSTLRRLVCGIFGA